MKLQNVCSKKIYEQNGEKKVKFYLVGILKTTDAGKQYLQLYHLPQTEFYVFDKDTTQPEIKIEE